MVHAEAVQSSHGRHHGGVIMTMNVLGNVAVHVRTFRQIAGARIRYEGV